MAQDYRDKFQNGSCKDEAERILRGEETFSEDLDPSAHPVPAAPDSSVGPPPAKPELKP
jgi:hypothetical protein